MCLVNILVLGDFWNPKWFDFLNVRNCTIHFLSLTLQE